MYDHASMRLLTLAVYIVIGFGNLSAQTPVWQPSPGHTQVPIWPGNAPDAVPVAGSEYVKMVGDAGEEPVVGKVSRPTLTVYSPRGKNTGAANGRVSGRWVLGFVYGS